MGLQADSDWQETVPKLQAVLDHVPWAWVNQVRRFSGQSPIQRASSSVGETRGAARPMPVRLFYDYLMEEGRPGTNPVGRGHYTR